MRLLPLTTGLFCMGLAPAQTYVVDKAGGGQFTDLPAAIAAVPSGAVLRVRAGTYSAFTLQGKALTILGEDASKTIVDLFMIDVGIGPTAPEQAVLIGNLRFRALLPLNSIWISDVLGPLTLADVQVVPNTSMAATSPMYIARSPNVHLLRCTFGAAVTGAPTPRDPKLDVWDSSVEIMGCTVLGEPGGSYTHGSSPGASALRAVNSTLFCYGSTFTGGRGVNASPEPLTFFPASEGGRGAVVQSSSLVHLIACTIVGGAGGNGSAVAPTGKAGGTGLVLDASQARAVGSSIHGGAGGTVGGAAGADTALAGGATLDLPAASAPLASVTGTAGPNQTIVCSLTTSPGDLAVLALGRVSALDQYPFVITTGAWMLAPEVTLGAWVVPGSGRLDLPFTLPAAFPFDQPVFVQFVTAPPAVTELWASNSDLVLARSR